MYSLDNYSLCEVEEIVYKHCQYYKSNPTQPCWGKVMKDTIHLPNYAEDPVGTTYYSCQGHWDCIEDGAYVPYKGDV